MENTFNIHNVKTVIERNTESQVNGFLDEGWILLSVGFETYGEKTEKIYVLGSIKDRKTLEEEWAASGDPFI